MLVEMKSKAAIKKIIRYFFLMCNYYILIFNYNLLFKNNKMGWFSKNNKRPLRVQKRKRKWRQSIYELMDKGIDMIDDILKMEF